ncbi:MAG: hypothetical protein ABJ239_09895 [Erythrobacter sp.]
MNKAIKIATVVSAAIALSGCQSFINKLGFGPKDQPTRAEAGQSVFGSDELEKGRTALKAGHPANAITQFRMAAMNEATAPDAFNGLGVAYAKLGRADLAERYFKMAVTLDANNPRYTANLTRFYNSALGTSSQALAMREKEAQATMASAANAAREQGMIEQESTIERRGALTFNKAAPIAVVRSSTAPRELRIATTTIDAGVAQLEMPEVAVRAPADNVRERPTRKFRAVRSGRISLLRPTSTSTRASTPVKIRVSKPSSGRATSPRGGQYPVRIALKRRDQSK